MKGFRVFVKIKKVKMANIDLKNLNLEDIKNQILKFADKKT